MAHKVKTSIKFSDMEQYIQMKNYLDNAGLKFDSFVSFAVNDVWNRMLEEYAKQLKAEAEDKQLLEEVKESIEAKANEANL